MSASLTKTQRLAAGIALLVVCACFIGASSGRDSPTADGDVKLIRTEKLANVPGQTLTVVTVNYPPGGKSRRHHHAGSVYAYVLSGAVRSENSQRGRSRSTRPARASLNRPAARTRDPHGHVRPLRGEGPGAGPRVDPASQTVRPCPARFEPVFELRSRFR
jgi:hypothetical protein